LCLFSQSKSLTLTLTQLYQQIHHEVPWPNLVPCPFASKRHGHPQGSNQTGCRRGEQISWHCHHHEARHTTHQLIGQQSYHSPTKTQNSKRNDEHDDDDDDDDPGSYRGSHNCNDDDDEHEHDDEQQSNDDDDDDEYPQRQPHGIPFNFPNALGFQISISLSHHCPHGFAFIWSHLWSNCWSHRVSHRWSHHRPNCQPYRRPHH